MLATLGILRGLVPDRLLKSPKLKLQVLDSFLILQQTLRDFEPASLQFHPFELGARLLQPLLGQGQLIQRRLPTGSEVLGEQHHLSQDGLALE